MPGKQPRPSGAWTSPRATRCAPDAAMSGRRRRPCPTSAAAAPRSLEGRGLARPVGADQGDDLALARPRARCPSAPRSCRSADEATSRTSSSTGRPRAQSSPSHPQVGLDDLRVLAHLGGHPSAIFSPKSSTLIRSQMSMTSPMSCSISRTVWPSSRIRRISSIARPSRPGSSRRPARRAAAASGSVASARAISSRRWSP